MVSSVDPSMIPESAASDMLNVTVEDRTIKPRKGYRNISAAPASFEKCCGFVYVNGYDGSFNGIEEYLSFEKRSGTVKPYSVNPSTGVRTKLTNGASELSLNDGDWFAVACQGKAYCFNSADGIYRRTLGSAASFAPMTMPSSPTTTIGWAFAPDNTVSWGTLDPTSGTSVAVTGAAANANSANESGILRICHTGSGAGSFQIVMDATGGPGKQDTKYRDCILFSLSAYDATKFDIDPSSVVVELANDDGTPKTLTASLVVYRQVQSGNYSFAAWFESGKTRADWGDGAGTGKTKKLKISYTVSKYTSSATSAQKGLRIWLTSFCGVRMVPTQNASEPGGTLGIGYSYYNSTSGWESDIGGVAEVPYSVLTGGIGAESTPSNKGARLTLTTVATGSADKVRHYVRDIDGYWHKVNEQDDTTLTFTLQINYLEVLACDVYSSRQFETTKKILCAAEFRNSIIWGYEDGVLRYSRQDTPEAQQSPYDKEDDTAKGADWPISAAKDDKPLAIVASGDYVYTAGSKGVYYQIGDRPSNMTNPARIHGSAGIAGRRAACAFQGGMAYVTKFGEILHATYEGISRIGTLLGDWLRGFLGSDLSECWIVYNEQRDSLLIGLGQQAVCLTRPNFTDGKRDWQPYKWASFVQIPSFTPQYGIVWERIGGEIDQFEVNSENGSFIEGGSRDAGSEMPEGYWQSKEFGDPSQRTRLYRLIADYEGALTAVAGSGGMSDEFVFDGPWMLCGAQQTGYKHTFRFIVNEDLESLKSFSAEAAAIGGRY